MKKPLTIAGALAGLFYAGYGMAAAYQHPPPEVVSGPGRIAMEFVVLAVFTVPLGAAVGMGVGLLLDGLFHRK